MRGVRTGVRGSLADQAYVTLLSCVQLDEPFLTHIVLRNSPASIFKLLRPILHYSFSIALLCFFRLSLASLKPRHSIRQSFENENAGRDQDSTSAHGPAHFGPSTDSHIQFIGPRAGDQQQDVVEEERALDGDHQALLGLPCDRRELEADGSIWRETFHW